MTRVAARGGGDKPCRLKEGVIPHPSHPTNADAFNVATRLLCRTVGTRGGRGREGEIQAKPVACNGLLLLLAPTPLPFLDRPTALCKYVHAVYCECPCFPDV